MAIGSTDLVSNRPNGQHRLTSLTFVPAKDLAHALARQLGGDVVRCGRGYQCRCPAHADTKPSLHLEDSPQGLVLASCFPCGNDRDAQTKLVAAIAELGFSLTPPRTEMSRAQQGSFVATYDYCDENGDLVFQVVRSAPKAFKQRRPNGSGGWEWEVKGCPKLPYRLPEVIEAIATGQPIFVVEGEKDVETAAKAGLVATCNARGAGKWTDDHSEHLREADVIIIPDNDDPGRAHAAAVAQSLAGQAARVRLLSLPELPPKGDLSDWLATGRSVEDLLRLVDTAAKDFPPQLMSQVSPRPRKADDARPSQSTTLIHLATSDSVALFHAPDEVAYADIVVGGHRETHPLRGPGFRRWLRRAYYLETGAAPSTDAVSTAMGVLEAKAHFDGEQRKVQLRTAEHDGRLYLDLCDPSWSAIEIDTAGWRKVSTPPVRFRRSPGMLPIPEPVHGGKIDQLRRHLHVDDDTFVLVVSWLLAVLRGRGPYPILACTGEQGTGKSLTADLLRSLVDPHTAPLRSLPKDTRELFVAAINSQVLAFDNLSGICAEISDCLCRLSTGGGFATRALYTDGDEVQFNGQRPIALTSIADVASRSDLADRLLIARLEAIPDDQRRPERELREAFEIDRPRILGALLDMVAHGLKELPRTHLSRLPRMADYALWMAACETSVWPDGTHTMAYDTNRGEAVETVLDADPLAMVLRQHMAARREHTATATELLTTLTALAPENIRRGRQWPGSPKSLSGQLTRLAPALRKIGITVSSSREGHTGRRLLHVFRETIEAT